MSKLYATIESWESGKIVSRSSNERLTVNLFKGNLNVGTLIINDYTGEIVFSRRTGNGYTPVYRTSINPCGHALCSPTICGNNLPF